MEEMLKGAAEFGVTLVLLSIMVKYFLDSNKNLVLQNENLYNQFVKDSSQREEQFRVDNKRREKEYRDRENILIAESTKREEILKQESERREQMLKSEAAKREATLMTTIKEFSVTMEKISETMDDIKDTTNVMYNEIGGIKNILQIDEIDIRSDEVGEKDGN